MKQKITFFPYPIESAFGLPGYGVDVQILAQDASLADLLSALDSFAAENLADCKGCDGCCHERAPLIAADIPLLADLLSPQEFPYHAVCAAFADLTVLENGAIDITLRRKPDSACTFLDTAGKFCRSWQNRPFVCRSHFCLPRSANFEQLRQDIVNGGENELARVLLAEEAIGAPTLLAQPLAKLVDSADYLPNVHSGKRDYAQILLCDCLDSTLWQALYQPQ